MINRLLVTLFFQSLALSLTAQQIVTADSDLIHLEGYSIKNSEVTADSKSVKTEFGLEVRRFKADSKPITTEVGEKTKFEEQQRLNSEILDNKKPDEEPIKENAKSIMYALFIGVSDYQFERVGFSNLEKPVQDAEQFSQTLTRHYQFENENTYLLKNPTKSEILGKIEKLARKIDADDNLLVFYAGHGYWDDFLNTGYWLAADAKIDDKSTWLSNSTLRDYIAAIPSKHTLLITDACFGGGIFKTRAAEDVSAYAVSKLYKMPSRKAFTSGTLTEVPDESVFMKYLLKNLESNQQNYLPVSQLFNDIRPAILNNSKTVPQLGVIQNTGDEGGEFVFIKR